MGQLLGRLTIRWPERPDATPAPRPKIVTRKDPVTEKVSTVGLRQRIGDMIDRVALQQDEFVIELAARLDPATRADAPVCETSGPGVPPATETPHVVRSRSYGARHRSPEVGPEAGPPPATRDEVTGGSGRPRRERLRQCGPPSRWSAGAHSRYIVTGDRPFLNLRQYRGVRVVAPRSSPRNPRCRLTGRSPAVSTSPRARRRERPISSWSSWMPPGPAFDTAGAPEYKSSRCRPAPQTRAGTVGPTWATAVTSPSRPHGRAPDFILMVVAISR
jgi:hypothetical protein